jgi:uncharacterized protein YkwD
MRLLRNRASAPASRRHRAPGAALAASWAPPLPPMALLPPATPAPRMAPTPQIAPTPRKAPQAPKARTAPRVLLAAVAAVLAATSALTAPAAAAAAASSAAAAAAAGAVMAPDPEALRREVLRRLNDERAAAGAPPLVLSHALDRAAQRHVEDIVASGSLRADHRPEQTMEYRLQAAGYDAHQWTENLMSGPANPAQLVAAWRDDDSDGTFRRLLEPAYIDLGVGIGRLDGAPLYAILFAVPQSAAFARETAGLRDLERVRAETLTRINAERRRAGSQPLVLDPSLDLAAQRHAEDMLSRSYFAHRGPDGRTVRDRARAAGFEWSAVGENIAEGQQSVKEAVEAWMRSAEHRENILDRRYTETGVGLTLGRDPKTGEYRILWVQTFGLPR